MIKKVGSKIKVSLLGVVALWDDCTLHIYSDRFVSTKSQKIMICTIYPEFNKLFRWQWSTENKSTNLALVWITNNKFEYGIEEDRLMILG